MQKQQSLPLQVSIAMSTKAMVLTVYGMCLTGHDVSRNTLCLHELSVTTCA